MSEKVIILPLHMYMHTVWKLQNSSRKKYPKKGATADKIDSWSLKFGLTSLWKKSQKIGAIADKIDSWFPKFGLTSL